MTPELLRAARQFPDASDEEVKAIAHTAGRYARMLEVADHDLPEAWKPWRLPALAILLGLFTRLSATPAAAPLSELVGAALHGFRAGLHADNDDTPPTAH